MGTSLSATLHTGLYMTLESSGKPIQWLMELSQSGEPFNDSWNWVIRGSVSMTHETESSGERIYDSWKMSHQRGLSLAHETESLGELIFDLRNWIIRGEYLLYGSWNWFIREVYLWLMKRSHQQRSLYVYDSRNWVIKGAYLWLMKLSRQVPVQTCINKIK